MIATQSPAGIPFPQVDCAHPGPTPIARAIAIGTLAAAPALAFAQQDGACEWRFSMHQANPGLSATTTALARFDPDGSGGPLPIMLIAGGGFGSAGLDPAGRVAAYDGQQWMSAGAGVDGFTNAFAVYSGGLIAAGNFLTAGGQPASRIARWNGSDWSPLGSGLNQEPRALAVYNGELYVAGDFSVAGGVLANRIARWNGSSWNAVGTGITGGVALVTSMAVVNGFLYVGGEFTAAGGVSAVNLARWNGSTWANTGNANGRVNAMAVFNDPASFGTLYVSGAFTNIAGVAANRVARLPGGVSPVWSAMGAGLPGEGRNAMLVRSSGPFSHEVVAICQDGNGRIMRFTASGWVDIGPNLGTETPRALAFHGGQYITSAANAVLYLDTANNAWAPLGPGFNDEIASMAVVGGELFMGGQFSYVSNQRHNRVVRWNGSGFLPAAGGMNGDVLALQEFQSTLWAGGTFTSAGGVPTHLVARWNGSGWDAAGLPGGTSVEAMAVHNGELYAAGVGVSPMRWTGSGWAPAGGALAGPVQVLASHAGFLYAGGRPGLIGTAMLARLDSTTGQWAPTFSPTTPNASVLDMESYAGSLYIAGDRLDASHCLLRLTSPTGQATIVGEVDSQGNPCLAREMHIYRGNLYVQGFFTRAGGLPALNFARFDGAGWFPAEGGTSSSPILMLGAMEEYQDELVIGGPFTAVIDTVVAPIGQVSHLWARWYCPEGGECYANCDGSTTAPILNVADFTCFLQQFAAGNPTANCDQSTTSPVLNVADFTCFLQSFAAGCP